MSLCDCYRLHKENKYNHTVKDFLNNPYINFSCKYELYVKREESGYTVPGLARGLMIVEMFNSSKRVLSTQDFAEQLGVTPSSIYRVVQTLTDMGYLSKLARNTYELGPQVVSNGFSFLASRDMVDIAAPHLQQLRDATSISCHLAILDGRDIIYIYRALASQRLSVNVPVGTRLPAHVTALGRALLSAHSERDLRQLYFGLQMDGYGSQHPQNLPQLSQLLETEKKQGYALSRSDNATAIAVAIHNHSGDIVAAINISGSDVIMQSGTFKRQLLGASNLISQELGYQVKASIIG